MPLNSTVEASSLGATMRDVRKRLEMIKAIFVNFGLVLFRECLKEANKHKREKQQFYRQEINSQVSYAKDLLNQNLKR